MRRCLFLAVLLMTAGPAGAHEDKLAGGEWVEKGQGGAHQPSIRFAAGRVSGSGGCNRFGGRYELAGDALSFSPLAATRMACAAEIMQRELAFFDMLGQVRHVQITGDDMRFLDDGGRELATLTRRIAE